MFYIKGTVGKVAYASLSSYAYGCADMLKCYFRRAQQSAAVCVYCADYVARHIFICLYPSEVLQWLMK